jgi:glycosyltransferase involved in cell wall biosynthesis
LLGLARNHQEIQGVSRDARAGDADRLRALHVVAGLYPHHGGPYYSVPRLCRALAACDVALTLYSVAAPGEGARETLVDGYRDHRLAWTCARAPILGSLRWSAEFATALGNAAAAADVVHDHGLWLLPNIQAGRAAARANKPLVVSPRGMLDKAALAFSRRKKSIIWHLLQGAVVRRAACIHATSEHEYEAVRAFGLGNPVAIVPNGIDVPEGEKASVAAQPHDRIVLTLGRIHPKKGLPGLLRAWARVETAHPAWRLRIVGPDEAGHELELRRIVAGLGLRRVSIEGPIYGDAKIEAYRAADLFVLPTFTENFGITAAEALAAGTPVIATKGAPWQGLGAQGCGWWIDHGEDALAATLTEVMALPRDVLQAMGTKGRDWMKRDFSWDSVAAQMRGVYCWLARAQPPPPIVRFD